ncbi:MAG TPA: endonuclease domain-containing protein [Thermoanaerobaculia bacterium]|nr:endonuclease domain-containing protein [Thermoanaerobaculia bacterium]
MPRKIATARNLRKRMTRAERILWRWLRDRRFLDTKFRRQFPIGPFVLDFYSPELRLAIEVDGAIHDRKALADRQRERFLIENHIAIVRLRNELVIREPVHAADQIRVAVEMRRR